MIFIDQRGRAREKRRHQILAAAKRVCAQRGIHHCSTRDIAAEAELSPSAIYLYFRNKEEIIAALSTRILKHLVVRLTYCKEKGDACLDDHLAGLRQALLDVRRVDPLLFDWALGIQSHRFLASIDRTLLQEIQGLLDQALDILARILAGCLGSKGEEPPRCRGFATVLWAFFTGVVLHGEQMLLLRRGRGAMEETLALAFEVAARGFRRIPPDAGNEPATGLTAGSGKPNNTRS